MSFSMMGDSLFLFVNMKIDIASDIHLAFGPCHLTNKSGADTLILAGDIFDSYLMQDNPSCIVSFFDRVCDQYEHVILVLGNHEHYGNLLTFHSGANGRISKVASELNGLLNRHGFSQYGSKSKTVHILENEKLELNGITILGGTGWTNFNSGNPVTMNQIHGIMNDYQHIGCAGSKLLPSDILKEHQFWKSWIEKTKELYNPESKCIIVTHHAPSTQSIHPRYGRTDPTNFAYCNNFEYFVENMTGLKYWIHGHVHDNFYYDLSDTCKVVCNPRGFVGHEVSHLASYDPVTIEI